MSLSNDKVDKLNDNKDVVKTDDKDINIVKTDDNKDDVKTDDNKYVVKLDVINSIFSWSGVIYFIICILAALYSYLNVNKYQDTFPKIMVSISAFFQGFFYFIKIMFLNIFGYKWIDEKNVVKNVVTKG